MKIGHKVRNKWQVAVVAAVTGFPYFKKSKFLAKMPFPHKIKERISSLMAIICVEKNMGAASLWLCLKLEAIPTDTPHIK
ncbi:MAG: hypothetical protein IPM82_00080 [Saprospiraceae bacterium]|nr:hypothetical protein [Saprospiraceae bacterium]